MQFLVEPLSSSIASFCYIHAHSVPAIASMPRCIPVPPDKFSSFSLGLDLQISVLHGSNYVENCSLG